MNDAAQTTDRPDDERDPSKLAVGDVIEVPWWYYKRGPVYYRRTPTGRCERTYTTWGGRWVEADDAYIEHLLRSLDMDLDPISLEEVRRFDPKATETVTIVLDQLGINMLRYHAINNALWRRVRADPPDLTGLDDFLRKVFPRYDE